MPAKEKLYRYWHTETKWHTKKLHSALPCFTVTWKGLKGLLYQFFWKLYVPCGLSETLQITNIKKTQSLSNSKNLLMSCTEKNYTRGSTHEEFVS